MKIRRYNPLSDFENLMDVIKSEGKEWSCYSSDSAIEKYRMALEKSITYVAELNNTLCGYSRSFNDNGFYIYVCDLLVLKPFRGNNIGRQLIECIQNDFQNQTIFVMSDVDEYYKKLGYRLEGSIFEVIHSS